MFDLSSFLSKFYTLKPPFPSHEARRNTKLRMLRRWRAVPCLLSWLWVIKARGRGGGDGGGQVLLATLMQLGLVHDFSAGPSAVWVLFRVEGL